jgi:hypothetical protein
MNIKEESIKRYEEKILWARTQNPDEKPDRKKMYNAIGHNWNGESCPYCGEYCSSVLDMIWESKCKLYTPFEDHDCGQLCCNGLRMIYWKRKETR